MVQGDEMHSRCARIISGAAKSAKRFVTSDYILDETATLLKARGHGRLIDPFFNAVLTSQALRIEWMDPERFDETRRLLLKHHDQGWSFTDCFSFHLMHVLHMRDVLTKDVHFRQAGFNPLLIN